MPAADSKEARPGYHLYGLVVAAAVLPRLGVLLHERGAITAAYVDKGDIFARTFLATGTYGFIPGRPSAYTQPLYGFFLIPLYWIFDRSWMTVGLAQIAVAAATAVVVFELGRRTVSAQVGLIAALLATLEPYLLWHDVHMNREILDQLLGAALVLSTLMLVARPTVLRGLATGALAGLAILGNVRLLLVPLLLACFVIACERRAYVPALLLVGAAAAVLTPWVVRNDVDVGCATLTTDARALWKANNPATLRVLEHGKWIDDVPGVAGAPPTPQDAGQVYRNTGRVIVTNECAQMRFYRRRALDFMRDHPGEKAKLAGVGARMLWQPAVTRTEGRQASGSFVDVGRKWIESAYVIALYALALLGLPLLPRRLAALAILLLVYTTLTAMLFAGETRYRAVWDFLIAIPAAAALSAAWTRVRRRGLFAA